VLYAIAMRQITTDPLCPRPHWGWGWSRWEAEQGESQVNHMSEI